MDRRQWLLIVVIVTGLIGMHHLVHLHTSHSHPAPVATTTAVLQADCCKSLTMVGDFCLAVLAAVTALVVALILATLWCRPLKPGYLLAPVNAGAARAPPISWPRFTQFCVLRC